MIIDICFIIDNDCVFTQNYYYLKYLNAQIILDLGDTINNVNTHYVIWVMAKYNEQR